MPKVIVEYTVRVKPEHKPCKFNDKMGEGVLVIETVELDIDKKYFPDMAMSMVYDHGEVIIDKYIDVKIKIIDGELK